MCLASAMFDSLPKVEVGQAAVVASSYGRKFFAQEGTQGHQHPEFCCIPSGSTVVLSGLPQRLQRRLSIGEEVVAVMISPDADRTMTDEDRDDEFQVVGTEQTFFLRELKVGTKLTRTDPVELSEIVDHPTDAIDHEANEVIAEVGARVNAGNGNVVPVAATRRTREMAVTA